MSEMKSVTVVTGAASGLGRAIAETLAISTAVILVDIDEGGLVEVASHLRDSGGSAAVVVGDVSVRQTHKTAAAKASEFGILSGWVNCAGINLGGRLHSYQEDPSDLHRVINVNQVGTLWGCIEALTNYVATKTEGAIVNISSVHGIRAWRDQAIYEMTKAAVEALTRNVAVVYGPYGIRANSVSPGAILTPVLEKSIRDASNPQKRRETLERITPLKRIAMPDEVAQVVAFLLSSKASYVSGQNLCVDGGWTASLGSGDLDGELAMRYGLNPTTGIRN